MRRFAVLLIPAFAATISPAAAQQDVPETAWLYVGRVADNGRFTAGPAIDSRSTAVSAGKVTRLQLNRDAALATNDECTSLKVDDLRAPSEEDLQKQYPLLRADRAPLAVQATSECPSAGKGKLLYAKVAVKKDRVRFASLADLNKR